MTCSHCGEPASHLDAAGYCMACARTAAGQDSARVLLAAAKTTHADIRVLLAACKLARFGGLDMGLEYIYEKGQRG